MTTNLLHIPGKARSRKDLSSIGSIPTLMALDEEESNNSISRIDINENGEVKQTKTDFRKYSDSNLPSPTLYENSAPQKKTKSSRRSSLGLGLLMGSNKNTDANKNGGKRRSSIAAILGRRNSNSKVCL